MVFRFGKLTELEKISYLQRFILVHSYIYYEMDSNLITDKQYDNAAQQLVKMAEVSDINKTDYGYVFCGFTGITGFDLYSKLTDKDKAKVKDMARIIMRNYEDSKYIKN